MDNGFPELSPDERRVTIQRSVKNNTDVYEWDLERASFRRLTIDPTVDQLPIWSYDGKSIAFTSTKKGAGNLYVKPSDSDGTTPGEPILESGQNKAPSDWSKDFFLYVEIDPKTGTDLWALDMRAKDRTPRAVANTSSDERMGQFSPDGRWVAYATNQSGQLEIVVQAFPIPGAKAQVSTKGGITPRWSADGRELYFVAPDGVLMAAAVAGAGLSFQAEPPKALFPTRLAGSGITLFQPQYAVSRDGRFLLNQPAQDSGASPITLILNWRP